MKFLRKLIVPIVLISVFTIGCKKDKEEEPAPTPTETPFTVNSNPEVSFKIDGTGDGYESGMGGVEQGISTGAVWGPNVISSIPGVYFYQIINATTTRTWFTLDKGILTWPTGTGSIDSTTWKNFFAAGTYSYVSQDFDPGVSQPEHGVILALEDENGVQWSTIKGSADQSGSNFEILQSIYHHYWGENHMKVKCTFNCKVYDDNGNMKTITEGTGILNFEIET